LFSLLSVSVVAPGADPGRIASGIATGIGFLGAGTIMRYGSSVHGLTTAASIWTAAAIGMACGLGAFIPAFTAAGLVLLTLGLLRPIAHAVRPRKGEVLISVTGSVAGDLLGEIVRKVRDTGGVVTAFEMAQEEDDHQVVLVRIRLPNATTTEDIIAAIAAMEGVRGAEAV
jgi:putative Mg2+ transporter-C (MgtC) family protein